VPTDGEYEQPPALDTPSGSARETLDEMHVRHDRFRDSKQRRANRNWRADDAIGLPRCGAMGGAWTRAWHDTLTSAGAPKRGARLAVTVPLPTKKAIR
jgi:hypothetical protein